MKKHKLILGCCYKAETPFLKEWIEFHRMVGVGRFYMFCNDDSLDESLVVLQPYVDKGIIDVTHFRTLNKRMSTRFGKAFRTSIAFGCRVARDEAEWFAHIDADEFLVPRTEGTIVDCIDRLDKKEVGAIGVHVKFFGSNNLTKRPSYQLKSYTRRASKHHRLSMLMKPLVRTTALDFSYPTPITGHSNVILKKGFVTVNSAGEKVSVSEKTPPAYDEFALHHYSMRSKEDFALKIERNWFGSKRRFSDKEKWAKWENPETNEVLDESVWVRFGTELQKRMS